MSDPVIKLKRSNVAGRVPTTSDLEAGEVALNLADAKIFSRDDNNNIVTLNPDVNNITNTFSLPNDWGYVSDSEGDEYDMGLITDPNDAPENAGFNQLQAASFILNGLTFPNTDGVAGQVITTDGNGNLSFINSATSASWQDVTTETYDASVGDKIIVNSTLQAVTVTLPANPFFGDEVHIIDGDGNSEVNNITINRNGRRIESEAEDFEIDVNGAAFNFVYYNAQRGWILQEK
tara:strand:- start:1103 stop:1804 length:702 start_codon:yes stop_codon:yes gene_type:complete